MLTSPRRSAEPQRAELRRQELRPVRATQEHDLGCGVAAVATLLGRPYGEVLRTAWGVEPPFRGGRYEIALTVRQMTRVLRRYGVMAKPENPSRMPAGLAILFFDWQPDDLVTGYHAVVWNPSARRPQVLDPCNATHGSPISFYEHRWRLSGRDTLVVL